MKERPILFSAPMVRAILDGRKTQTRRIISPRPKQNWPMKSCGILTCQAHNLHAQQVAVFDCLNGFTMPYKCPYGKPGDHLWVRETFDPIYPQDPKYNGGRPIEIDYAATPRERIKDHHGMRKWKPSIHMPRWASRIQLEVTGIRVERLQDISGIDAKAEGVSIPAHLPHDGADLDLALREYKVLWESINGPGSWDANPWVWVVDFKVLKP